MLIAFALSALLVLLLTAVALQLSSHNPTSGAKRSAESVARGVVKRVPVGIWGGASCPPLLLCAGDTAPNSRRGGYYSRH